MKPKEIQEKLGIDANRIKLYKREKIFTPENPPKKNRPTEYTERDFERLQRIVTLNKCGLTCADIRNVLEGTASFAATIETRKANIESDIERKRNSLSLLEALGKSDVQFETFDSAHFWGVIKSRETAGEEFIRFEELGDYIPVPLTREVKCPHCGVTTEIDLEDYLASSDCSEDGGDMGPDIVYTFDSEDNVECPNCGKGVRVSGWIREYPVGAYDSESIAVVPFGN